MTLDQRQVVLLAVGVQVAARVGCIERRAVIVRVDFFQHRDRFHHFFFGLGGQAQHIVGPDGNTIPAADARRLQVLRSLGALANEPQDSVAAALKADQVPSQTRFGHQAHHVLVLDDDVGTALAEEGLTEARLAVGLTEGDDPLSILSQAVIVEHQAVEGVALVELPQLGHDIGHAAPPHTTAKDVPLRRLTVAAVVDAAPAGDDGHKRRRQLGYKGRLWRVLLIAPLAPLLKKQLVIGERYRVQIRLDRADDPFARLAALAPLQEIGEGNLRLSQKDVINQRAVLDFVGHNRGMSPADNGDGVG